MCAFSLPSRLKQPLDLHHELYLRTRQHIVPHYYTINICTTVHSVSDRRCAVVAAHVIWENIAMHLGKGSCARKFWSAHESRKRRDCMCGLRRRKFYWLFWARFSLQAKKLCGGLFYRARGRIKGVLAGYWEVIRRFTFYILSIPS